MNNCDRCGLDDYDCKCDLWDLKKRVDFLEECIKAIIDDVSGLYKIKDAKCMDNDEEF